MSLEVASYLRFETVTDGAAAAPLVTEYRHDPDGRLETLLHPSGLAVQYDRDPVNGSVSSVRDLSSGVPFASAVAFLPGGPLAHLAFGNGTSLDQTFNLRYEPLSIASGPVSLAYTPSPAGDVVSIASPEVTETFGYDFADRLTRRSSTSGIRADPRTYVYQGGRVTQSQEAGIPRHAFGYDDQLSLAAISSYDAAGTALSATVCLVHDALGRLVLAGLADPGAGGPDRIACRSEDEVQEVLARFRYDALNRRVAREDASGWTFFAFDAAGQPISELAVAGGAASPLRDYVWLGATPIAQVEHATGAPRVYAVHADHLGTPRALTSPAGQTAWSASMAKEAAVARAAAEEKRRLRSRSCAGRASGRRTRTSSAKWKRPTGRASRACWGARGPRRREGVNGASGGVAGATEGH